MLVLITLSIIESSCHLLLKSNAQRSEGQIFREGCIVHKLIYFLSYRDVRCGFKGLHRPACIKYSRQKDIILMIFRFMYVFS